MKKELVKQIITGILGTILFAVLFVLAASPLVSSNKWLIYVLIAAAVGGTFGCLLYTFGSKDMFFYDGGLGLIFVAFIVFAKELSQPFKGFFIAVCAVLLIAVPFIREYLYDREKNSPTPSIKRIAK
jgi:hypothetical protein